MKNDRKTAQNRRKSRKKQTKHSVKICIEPNEIVKTCETRQNVPAGKVLTKPVSYV